MAEVKKTFKAIVDKHICKEIDEFIDSGIHDLGIRWSSDMNRQSFVEIIEDELQGYVEDGLIEQYKVIMDKRNNKAADMANGIYKLEVHFRQMHCLTVTKLLYTITDNGSKDDRYYSLDYVI
jgi:hypothetical protein